jgi:hypothetical protein
MNDIEIDKALALAIGWKPEQMLFHKAQSGYEWMTILVRDFEQYGHYFDYRDWNVIGPIMERYNASPMKSPKGTWSACVDEVWVDHVDTPQKAIALAVIEGAKK